MGRPLKLDSSVVDSWLAAHIGWVREGGALVRTFETPDFASALAFAVRIGRLAETRDHHPELLIGWGKVRVLWTTHDQGGITRLDLELAEETAQLAAKGRES